MAKKAGTKKKLKPSPGNRQMAMYIAKVVRDEMEDFHVEHIPDEYMTELNTIIRDAICTALYASEHYADSAAAKAFVTNLWQTIPNSWEEPKLTKDFLDVVELYEQSAAEKKES